jgi:carbon-monoxide dehydrogenase large subunit
MKWPNTFVGSPVERVEDLRFLRGRGEYLDDVSREGQWHAAILRSSVAHGRIVSIDASAALVRTGVCAVFTAAEIGQPVPRIPLRPPNSGGAALFEQPVIADGVVRYVGEPIAVILAEAPEIAEDALADISIEIAPLPVVVDPSVSGRDEIRLFTDAASNCAATYKVTRGDADAAFAQAAYTRREQFSVQRHLALPMETRGVLAEWDARASHLTVWGAAKVPFANRQALAGMLQLPESSVDLIECDVGGGFGARGEFYPEDFLIPFAARHYGSPVKWVEDRREHFVSLNHARDASCDIEIACSADGTFLGLRGRTTVDIGAYARPSVMNTVRNVAQFLSGPYRIPNIDITSYGLLSNKTPNGVYRGPGRFESSFFCERLVDLVARDLGLDRLEIRRLNLIAREEMPYALAISEPSDGLPPAICDSGDYAEAFEQCLKEFGWAEKLAIDGQRVGDRYHGIGIGCFIEGGGAGPRENARIAAEADGSVSVYVGSSAIGQGLETSHSQIAADALGLPMERIRVLHGSTTLLHEGFGSFASRATVMGGSAILAAAERFQDKMRELAAAWLGTAPADLQINGDAATAPDGRRVTIAQLAANGLAADGTFSSSKPTYAYGTAAAHVAVDPKTGHVALLDYVVVDDVGRAINPLTLHGQVLGAIVQGLGGVFTEELPYDAEGQLLVGSLADYLPPLATDFPHIRAVTTERHPSPNNPLGAKGAGEGGIIAPGGVLANAVASALRTFGVQPRQLPLSPSRLWDLIQSAR